MKVILHAGAHATDEGRLLRGLLRNADDLAARAVAVPGPSRYRKLLSASLHALGHGEPAPEARDILLEEILDDDPDSFGRVVLSHEHLFCVPKIALGAGRLYPKAEARMGNLAGCFPTTGSSCFSGCATRRPGCRRSMPRRRTGISRISSMAATRSPCAGPS